MQYDKSKYVIWDIKHPIILFWVLFPATFFNELIIGQRLPKVMLIEKNSQKKLAEKTIVPCPNCGEKHDGMLWKGKNAFFNWFGYVCPSCEKPIPSLWSIWSLLILAITSPIWYPFKNYIKPKLVNRQLTLLGVNQEKSDLHKAPGIWKLGFVAAALFFVINIMSFYIQGKSNSFNIANQLLGAALYGFILSYFLHLVFFVKRSRSLGQSLYESNDKKAIAGFFILKSIIFALVMFAIAFVKNKWKIIESMEIDSALVPYQAVLKITNHESLLSLAGLCMGIFLLLIYFLIKYSYQLILDFENNLSFTNDSITNCRGLAYSFAFLAIFDYVLKSHVMPFFATQYSVPGLIFTENLSGVQLPINYSLILCSVLFFALVGVLKKGTEIKDEIDATI